MTPKTFDLTACGTLMRRSAILLVLVFLLPAYSSMAATVDGDLTDWSEESHMGTDSNGVSFHLDWDSTNLYIAWNGTDLSSSSEGADLFFYLNTSEGGSVTTKSWNGIKTLPFAADYAVVVEDSSYASIIEFNGMQWDDLAAPEIHAGWSDNKVTELSIPLVEIGNPSHLELISWGQWQDAGNVWAAFPMNNSFSQFSHFYSATDLANQGPEDVTIEERSTPEKVSDALNLAIIFHQHQPYYKNKLTDMYEMPWVRVHAMTEYVDSPGILEKYPGTKVTYNLVPSLMEQLLDYHRQETLDAHTDIAKRPWPQGDYPNATELELHVMQFQSFWNSGWIYNVSAEDPNAWVMASSEMYSYLHGKTKHNLKPATIMDDDLLPPQEFLDLQVLWYLYQFSPDYVLGTYDASHRDDGLIALFQQNGNFTHDDLMYVLDAQHEHMGNVLPMYSDLAAAGQVELTTTPYYHPILPLLMMPGWEMEDGIRVSKQAWPDDVQTHLTTGMDLFEDEMGFRPVGMWPSEEAVSPAMVQPVTDVGIEWMVTDEELLMKSTDMNGNNVDVSNAANLAMPWVATGEDGGEVAVVFRDRVISDRVAWNYGSMTPEDAVTDFVSYVDDVRQQLLDAGEDPSEHLLTVSMDGENWMFMSEFQHNDNGRPFVDEWFSRLETHPTIVTTTPGEFLEEERDLPKIDTIGTGSWVDGTLSTWAGEAEESLGWQRLIEARKALVAFEADNPTHPGLDAAWESLYIAEGSDWFWWYGLDQDSGYDENWDVLFKVHLSNIYRAVDLELPPYLQDLWTNPSIPDAAYGGTIEPMIDGVALPGEWDGAARYDADSITGTGLDIESFHVGYDSNNVYVRVDVNDDGSVSDKAIEIYFMQPNAVNFNEAETNFRTAIGGEILGFPAKNLIRFDFDELRDDGRSKWTGLSAKGIIGSSEVWASPVNSNLGDCAVDDVYEFQIPWSQLGLAPRYSTRIKVVVADATSDLEMAPPAPAEMVLPELEEWVTLLEMNDDSDDGNGDGTITLPTASDFAGGMSLFDIQGVKIEQSDWNARFTFEMGEITNYWSLSNGFSHQIIQIYVDKGDTENGRTDMLPGANAEIHSDWAWEVVISGTGEPGAVFSVQSDTGSTSARGLDVEGDKDTNTIVFTVSKDVIGSDVASYRYIVVSGSQDGFGTGKWRDVDETAKTWTLGGGSDPSSEDGLDYDPNILDIVRTDDEQTNILSGYDVENQIYAQLTGFEIPEISQQIYGANVLTVTDNSAIISWSTTKQSESRVYCIEMGQLEKEVNVSSSQLVISHQMEVGGLNAGKSYSCTISSPSEPSIEQSIEFTTLSDSDSTAPLILNIRTLTDDNGITTVSWFTDEDTFGVIDLDSKEQTGFGKNHAVSNSLCVGKHSAEITATDPSGNAAVESITFSVVGDGEKCSASNGDRKVDSDHRASMLTSTNVQIVALTVVLLVTLALIRTRKEKFD
ncbi:MAG: hypothetical protein DWC02_00940 [Candidatus Poseidoniales archaeon]|nr:MAG: hypothetical protein DWC02_00940 [Candidatus Poseidoniales archaeon]